MMFNFLILVSVMETVTMNLPIEMQVAKRIKRYASARKTTVSSIVENFFTVVTIADKADDTEISPLVASFSINNVNVPVDFDYKTALADARNEKYLR